MMIIRPLANLGCGRPLQGCKTYSHINGVCFYIPPSIIAAREHLSLRLSVAHSAIDHPPLGHLLFSHHSRCEGHCEEVENIMTATRIEPVISGI